AGPHLPAVPARATRADGPTHCDHTSTPGPAAAPLPALCPSHSHLRVLPSRPRKCPGPPDTAQPSVRAHATRLSRSGKPALPTPPPGLSPTFPQSYDLTAALPPTCGAGAIAGTVLNVRGGGNSPKTSPVGCWKARDGGDPPRRAGVGRRRRGPLAIRSGPDRTAASGARLPRETR